MADAGRLAVRHDFRRTLLDMALHLITTYGIDTFTFREVIRRTGVSPTADDRHDLDKAALIEALLSNVPILHACPPQDTQPHAWPSLDQLAVVAIRCVTYALEHPTQFRLLHRPELRDGNGEHPGLLEHAANAAFSVPLDRIIVGQVAPFDHPNSRDTP